MIYLLILIYLLYFSYTDLKENLIYNKSIIPLLLFSFIFSLISFGFISTFIYLILFYVTSYLLIKLKIWKGGDVKIYLFLTLLLNNNIIIFSLILFSLEFLIGIYYYLKGINKNIAFAPVFLISYIIYLVI